MQDKLFLTFNYCHEALDECLGFVIVSGRLLLVVVLNLT